MFRAASLVAFTYLAVAHAQQVGTLTAETHPSLSWSTCTAGGACTTNAGQVVLDANWRWLHSVSGSTNCYTGNTWDTTLCPDPTTCANNCALDGADYEGTYGVTATGDSLTLKFVTQGTNKNVGSRLYLMSSETEYELFKPLNQEFTFDVDVSQLPCGLNGALYFSEMSADGGLAAYPTNKAGAKYGTGYCDSQCPKDLKFIDGLANVNDWTGDSNSANSGTGEFGSCCTEMDIWEANSISAAFTPHPCSVVGQTQCSGTQCAGVSGGVCDPDGCDFNSFRVGDTSFYGPSMTVDTTQKFTVVTQFITDDGTSSGTLSQINRFYVQNGVVIPNSNTNIAGIDTTNAISENFCDQANTAFNESGSFQTQGGLQTMSESFTRGAVLVLSIWDDYAVDMLWLDSDYPTTADPSAPGVARGTCATTSGVPATVEADSPNAQVIYSNIKFGPINSTFTAPGTGTGSTTVSSSHTSTTTSSTVSRSSTSSVSAPAATQTQYGQCGGTGFTGPTTCASGTTCTVLNPYYSQCL